jgi:hypothetical protein
MTWRSKRIPNIRHAPIAYLNDNRTVARDPALSCHGQLQLLAQNPLRVAQQWKRQPQYLAYQLLYHRGLSGDPEKLDVLRLELLV